jgi:hypothetical protein
MPLFAPCHDAHGIPGDVAAGSGHGFSAVVAPADAAVRGVSKLDARPRLDVAVSAMFSERLDVALDCVGVRSVSELLAALGCLFLPNVSERILRADGPQRRALGGWGRRTHTVNLPLVTSWTGPRPWVRGRMLFAGSAS